MAGMSVAMWALWEMMRADSKGTWRAGWLVGPKVLSMAGRRAGTRAS